MKENFIVAWKFSSRVEKNFMRSLRSHVKYLFNTRRKQRPLVRLAITPPDWRELFFKRDVIRTIHCVNQYGCLCHALYFVFRFGLCDIKCQFTLFLGASRPFCFDRAKGNICRGRPIRPSPNRNGTEDCCLEPNAMYYTNISLRIFHFLVGADCYPCNPTGKPTSGKKVQHSFQWIHFESH